MEKEPKYIPSSEEVKKAEEMMTDEQKKMSNKRIDEIVDKWDDGKSLDERIKETFKKERDYQNYKKEKEKKKIEKRARGEWDEEDKNLLRMSLIEKKLKLCSQGLLRTREGIVNSSEYLYDPHANKATFQTPQGKFLVSLSELFLQGESMSLKESVENEIQRIIDEAKEKE